MTYKGNDGVFKAITSTGTHAAVGEVKSFNIQTVGDTVEDTSMGDDSRTYKPGLKSFSLNIEAHYDPSDGAQADLIEGEAIDFELLPESGNKLTGSAIVTGVSISNEFDNSIVSVSITAQGTGDLTRAAVSG
jgi:hypothetical protein